MISQMVQEALTPAPWRLLSRPPHQISHLTSTIPISQPDWDELYTPGKTVITDLPEGFKVQICALWPINPLHGPREGCCHNLSLTP